MGSGNSEDFGVTLHSAIGSSAQADIESCCMQISYDMTLSSPWKNYLLS